MDTDVAKDDAARQRIITHMNEDHGDSVRLEVANEITP